MTEQALRGLFIHAMPEGPAAPVECQVTFTVTQLPQELRLEVINAMVDSANRYLHSLEIYPLPQLTHEVRGLEAACPQRVYGNVQPFHNTPRRAANQPTSAAADTVSERTVDRFVQQLSEVIGRSREPPARPTATGSPAQPARQLVAYVDTVLGSHDGLGTYAKPFRTVAQAVDYLRRLNRPAVVRDRSGNLLGTYRVP